MKLTPSPDLAPEKSKAQTSNITPDNSTTSSRTNIKPSTSKIAAGIISAAVAVPPRKKLDPITPKPKTHPGTGAGGARQRGIPLLPPAPKKPDPVPTNSSIKPNKQSKGLLSQKNAKASPLLAKTSKPNPKTKAKPAAINARGKTGSITNSTGNKNKNKDEDGDGEGRGSDTEVEEDMVESQRTMNKVDIEQDDGDDGVELDSE